MKNSILSFSALFITKLVCAQNPCFIKYTYDASGNRIKREFVCEPLPPDPIDPELCCPPNNNGAKIAKGNNKLETDSLSFTLQPNPAKNEIILSVNALEPSKLNGVILNNLGQEIMVFEIDGVGFVRLDISNLSAGLYFAVLKTNKGQLIKKFAKVD